MTLISPIRDKVENIEKLPLDEVDQLKHQLAMLEIWALSGGAAILDGYEGAET